MNSFFKYLLGVLLALFSSAAFAVNIQAVYTAACTRELGLILDVTPTHIRFLNIHGELKDILRYEIIFIADYPFDRIPLSSGKGLINFSKTRVDTLKDGKVVPLVTGWPIGFSKEKISFLTDTGDESIVSRSSIFKIETLPPGENVYFTHTQDPKLFEFIHPYAFRECPIDNKKLLVYPQQILSDPVVIKRELDQLSSGFKKLDRYEIEEHFYPVPEVFTNRTSLGVWNNWGSRYGSAGKRSNNLTPALIDEHSSDVFGYQHEIITGSAPNTSFVHEEPQTQLYYTFKASYFHFGFFVDPSAVLVGKTYNWRDSDFQTFDGRMKEVSQLEMGFDVTNWSIHLTPIDNINFGFYDQAMTYQDTIPALGYGLGFRNYIWGLDVDRKTGSKDFTYQDKKTTYFIFNNKSDIDSLRLNFHLYTVPKTIFTYSFISRDLNLKGTNQFTTKSNTHYLLWDYNYSHQYKFGGYLSYESINKTVATTYLINSGSVVYFKFGAFAGLSF